MDVVEETIRDLHARGIAVLMDDFGSAYSSLNMLKDINVDAIKLDMKFVDLNADNAAKGLKIIESVIDMAYQLRLSIIARVRETAEQVSKCVNWDACTSKDIISTVRSLWERWRICWNTARMTSILEYLQRSDASRLPHVDERPQHARIVVIVGAYF